MNRGPLRSPGARRLGAASGSLGDVLVVVDTRDDYAGQLLYPA